MNTKDVCVRRKLIMCIMSNVNFKGNPLPIFSTYITGILEILWIQIPYIGNSWKQMITEVINR